MNKKMNLKEKGFADIVGFKKKKVKTRLTLLRFTVMNMKHIRVKILFVYFCLDWFPGTVTETEQHTFRTSIELR